MYDMILLHDDRTLALSVCLSVSLSVLSMRLSVCLCVCLTVHLSGLLTVRLTLSLSAAGHRQSVAGVWRRAVESQSAVTCV